MASFPKAGGSGPDFNEMEQDITKFASVPSVNEVLSNGVDLNHYHQQINQELEEAQKASLEDYMSQIDQSASLRDEIASCDSVLAGMEDVLLKFNDTLGKLSSDICTLQAKSQSITTKLSNRRQLEEKLGEFTSEIILTHQFIHNICDSTVGPSYIPIIEELQRKIRFSKRKESKASTAAQEIRIPLDRLRAKASDNIRKFILSKIDELRDHYGTEQISIQTTLLSCKSLLAFLKENSPDIDQAIREYYIQILSRIYLANFSMLSKRIQRQMVPLSSETIVPARQKGFWQKASSAEVSFSIGDRIKLLAEISAPPQSFGDGTYPIEAFMRSLYQIFIDAVTAEHYFASEFFNDLSITSSIFSPTTKYLEAFLDSILPKISDPICSAIFLKFSLANINEMRKRGITAANSHLELVSRKYTERFSAIIQENFSAVTATDPSIFFENPQTSHHASSVSRRFGEMAASLTQLMSTEVNEAIQAGLTRISDCVIDLTERTAKKFTTKELSTVFLINNYFLILSTLRAVDGCKFLPQFEAKLSSNISAFVDISIHGQFSELYDAVTSSFTELEKKEDPRKSDFSETTLKGIAIDFKEKHVQKMKQIADSHILLFGDFGNGREILKCTAKRLVLIWTKFTHLCAFCIKTNASWLSNIITPQQVVVNIRPLTEQF